MPVRTDSRLWHFLTSEHRVPPGNLSIQHSLVVLILTEFDIPERLTSTDALVVRRPPLQPPASQDTERTGHG